MSRNHARTWLERLVPLQPNKCGVLYVTDGKTSNPLSDSIFPLKNANRSVGLTIIKLKPLIKTVHAPLPCPQLKMKLLHIKDLPNGKTLYLEYRQFDDNGNKYDTKTRNSIRAIPVT